MKTSATVMKATMKEGDLDHADELLEDLNEQIDQVQEMNEVMAQPLGQIMDDDELEAELAELEELEADELLNDLPASTYNAPVNVNHEVSLDLPSAPNNAINNNSFVCVCLVVCVLCVCVFYRCRGR